MINIQRNINIFKKWFFKKLWKNNEKAKNTKNKRRQKTSNNKGNIENTLSRETKENNKISKNDF